jgi:hypothetical protein
MGYSSATGASHPKKALHAPTKGKNEQLKRAALEMNFKERNNV